jgi:uncharacterized protein (TIGR02246 family)
MPVDQTRKQEEKMEVSDMQSIEALFSEFAWCADRGLGQQMAELFVEDGVLAIGGQEFQGRERIGEICQQRAQAPRQTRHSWSTLRVARHEGNLAATSAVQTTFERADAQAAPMVRVSDLLDQLVKSADGVWRFQRREISRMISVGE